MNNELVSIIVPVYNTSEFLEKCINSILNQTYSNIEIILVNDGSTDDSQLIIDKYKEIDSRIIALTKENGGLSSSRNKGLEVARGSYINFVDSDDFMMPREIEIMYTEMKKHDAQMSICGYSKTSVENYDQNYKTIELDNHELMKELFIDDRITSHSWRKLYPVDVFKKYKFPEDGKIVLDMSIDPYFLKEIEKAVYITAPLYVYCYENPTNITNINAKKFKSSFHRAIRLIERLEFSDKYYPDLSYILIPQLSNFLLSSYVKSMQGDVKKEDVNYILSNLKKYKSRFFKDKNIPFSNKVVIYSIINNIKPIVYLAKSYYFNVFSN